MEPPAIRSEVVNDLRPVENSLSQRLVYLLLTFIGVVFIFSGAYARYLAKESWIPEVCIAFGVAVTAPGILSYLYRRYLVGAIKAELDRPVLEFKGEALAKIEELLEEVKESQEEKCSCVRENFQALMRDYSERIALIKSLEFAKLFGVYHSRRAALKAFREFVERENDHVLVLGSSLLGLLQEPAEEYAAIREVLKSKLSKGTDIKFLLTHPRIADLRVQQEARRPMDIGREIIKSLRILLEQWKVPAQSIQLYLGTPTCFGIITGEAMLLNVYPYMKEAYASPCFIVLKGGYIYEHFESSHFRAWSSAMAEPVDSKSPVELQKKLNEFADEITRLTGQQQTP